MRIKLAGAVNITEDPRESASWLAEHFGFTVQVDLGWYVNTQHPDLPGLSVDFMAADHESLPASLRGADRSTRGLFLGLLVDDVDAEEKRLRAAGLDVIMPLVTEPWGQRRFQVAGPGGAVVEVLQLVEPSAEWMAANGLA
ncbi:VOC family protein [Allonocardiopsis opalescens]|uniref:Putative glyoxalase superfamily protein PhnB n=1 Tax=Allonocardiopsis opalescens TaxID=1144618 RepID=A0A2T0Q0L7_9ACTN|nr:VOC family protein [Allonocardiopsis opalescens]PRX97330.1 putative glyoxalase superfamily protein PhnB [Allonocardiopsis opalescens]